MQIQILWLRAQGGSAEDQGKGRMTTEKIYVKVNAKKKQLLDGVEQVVKFSRK